MCTCVHVYVRCVRHIQKKHELTADDALQTADDIEGTAIAALALC